MLKVNNGKIIRNLARKEYIGNLKRNLLMVLAIVLTTLLIVVVFGLGGSYWKTVARRTVIQEGVKYDVALPEPTQEQVRKAYKIPEIKYAGLSVKCAVILDSSKKQDTKVRLYWCDNTNWNEQCLPAFEFIEGRYPQEENEVILSTTSLKALDIKEPKIGMKISCPYSYLSMKNEEVQEGIFTLTGYYREYSGQNNGYVSERFYKKTGAKQTDLTQGLLYMTLQQSLYSKTEIGNIANEIGLLGNQIIYADYELLENFVKMIGALLLLLFLVFASGYLFIYNIVYISLAREVRYYGQMKTLGMTGRQLKKYVRWQILWNALVGIPIGLFLGAIVSNVIVPDAIQGLLTTSVKSQVLVFNPLILGGAAAFSSFTVWISSFYPVKLAAKMSPIETTRFTGHKNCKRTKKRINGGKISGMAWENIFREKKQAAVIFLSLFVAMSSFMTISTLIQGNSAKTVLNKIFSYDLRLQNAETLEGKQVITSDTLEELGSIKEIEQIRIVYSQQIIYNYNNEILQDYLKRLYDLPIMSDSQYEADLDSYEQDPEFYNFTGRLIGIDENGFDLLNNHLSAKLNKEKFLAGKIAIINPFLNDVSLEKLVGERIEYRLPQKDGGEKYSVKIAEECLENGIMPNYYVSGLGPSIVVSNRMFESIVQNPVIESVDITYIKPFDNTVDGKIRSLFEDIKGLNILSKMDDYNEMIQTEKQMRVLGGSLCFVLAVLALLNFGNVMVVSIQNRSREFATLSSVGMTKKQIKKMLLLEGVGYASISIGATIIVGVPLAHMIFEGLNTYKVDFLIPVTENILVVLFILICCMLIPIGTYKVLQKGSLVEQMKK